MYRISPCHRLPISPASVVSAPVSNGGDVALGVVADPPVELFGERTGVVMWADVVDREVSARIHRVIGDVLTSGVGCGGVIGATRQVLGEQPVSGVRASSVRFRIASATGTYLRRFVPDATLLGVGMRVGGGVADLVWAHKGLVAIDELKSGAIGCDDARGVAHLHCLVDGGRLMWGASFVGVRLVALLTPGPTVLVQTNLVPTEFSVLPEWLQVRT